MIITALIALIPLLGVPAEALENGQARTPQMGWNSWNQVRCQVSDSVVRAAADALISTGLAAKGYDTVIVDDCWQAYERDNDGNLQPNPDRFPNGIKAVADYVHAKGLRFGIYGAPGNDTCANYWDKYPGHLGSHGHEQQDANLWASWGVDYVKYDWCRADVVGLEEIPAFTKMRDALKATGRPMLYSISEYGQEQPWTWAEPIANSWRTTNDLQPNWKSIATNIQAQVTLYPYASPGSWNDPDMLQVGNGKLSTDETKSHMALWAMQAGPLLLGTDVSKLDADTLAIIGNDRLIAIDQDALGQQAHVQDTSGAVQLWVRVLSGGREAFAVYNPGDSAATVAVILQPSSDDLVDVWTGKEGTADTRTLNMTVPAHGTALYTHSVLGGNLTMDVTAIGNSPHTYTNVASGTCLDVYRGSSANGTPMEMWSCNGGDNQKFLTNADGTISTLGKCLDMADGTTHTGVAVVINSCDTTRASQKWAYDGTTKTIKSPAGICFDLSGSGNGARIVSKTCSATGGTQQWKLDA